MIDPFTPITACFGGQVFIDGSLSSFGSDISYEWTTDIGNIVGPTDESSTMVDETGEYILTVIFDDGVTFCEVDTSIFIEFIELDIDIDSPTEIDCNGTPIELDGSDSSTGNNITLSLIHISEPTRPY